MLFSLLSYSLFPLLLELAVGFALGFLFCSTLFASSTLFFLLLAPTSSVLPIVA
jgi:hypothetical protein